MSRECEEIQALIRSRLADVVAERLAWREKVYAILREEKENVYIWGMGQVGQKALHDLLVCGVKPYAFIDNNDACWGKEYFGLECLSPKELRPEDDPIIVLGLGTHAHEVSAQLTEMGIHRVLDFVDFMLNLIFDDLLEVPPENIAERVGLCFELLADEESREVLYKRLKGFLEFEPGFGKAQYYHEICRGDQYFLSELVHFTADDVLVDCGAYTGDTMEDFLGRGQPFQKYIAYELSGRNYDILCRNMAKCSEAEKLVAYNYGVGEKAEKIFYDENISATAVAAEGTPGEIVRMSDHLAGERVTFIKMDIEGAERAALRGGEELIRREQPKLAICVYHRISDLWELPLMMHEMEPGHKLYLRHHTPVYCETVCYSLPC